MNESDAELSCKALFSSLIKIDSNEEFNWLQNFSKENNIKSLWVTFFILRIFINLSDRFNNNAFNACNLNFFYFFE